MTSLKSVGRMSRTGGLVFVLLSAGAGNSAASAQTLTTLASFNESNGAGPAFGSLISTPGVTSSAQPNTGGVRSWHGVRDRQDLSRLCKHTNHPGHLQQYQRRASGSRPDRRRQRRPLRHNPIRGASGDGTVFEIANQCVAADETKQPQDQGDPEDHKDCPEHFSRRYASTPTTLVSFDNTNGASPAASLIADAKGNLFGTTEAGGAYGDGTVFEIANQCVALRDQAITGPGGPRRLSRAFLEEVCKHTNHPRQLRRYQWRASGSEPDRRRQRRPLRHN